MQRILRDYPSFTEALDWPRDLAKARFIPKVGNPLRRRPASTRYAMMMIRVSASSSRGGADAIQGAGASGLIVPVQA